MGLVFELEESDFAGYIEDGATYGATITNVRLRDAGPRGNPWKDDNGNTIRKVEFSFKLISDDGHDGQDIWGETSTKFSSHPNCRLKQWAEAILGMRLPAGFKLDTDTLVGRRCLVVIEKKTYTKDNEERVRNEVREVLPTPQAARQLAAGTEEDF